MAARDRFGGFAEPTMTPLQRYIMNACDPQNFEPNLALNIEIAELVNQKKGSAPREAAMEIVKFVNSRNPNVSLLALNLLDICVKNCGYPFHLQISTKEFLNELVRRFPERPPVHSSRVQNRILELIEEWRSTICMTSRYKEDLGFIRDMHRLLSYKGYTFPAIRREDAAVLNPSDNLRSAEEMEQEEREAQSAKLQELIRRGTPHDLQEANRLMKVMAGFDTRNKTDYRAKAAEEVGKIQQKAKLLEDMLQKHQAGDQIKEGDVFEELANALASAHPKIQKMCEEESDDHEAVAKLLEINDSIHRTLERYKLIKKGDVEGAAKIPKGTLGVSGAGVKKGPDNELSLIDFGGPDEATAPAGQPSASSSAAAPKGNALEDDLLGLNLGGNDSFQGGGISLGATNGAAFQLQPTSQTPVQNLLGGGPPASQPTSPQPNYNAFAGLGGPSLAPQPTPPQQTSMFSPPPQQPPQKAADPFAALASPRTASPFQFQQSVKPAASPSSALVGLGGTSTPPPAAPAPAPAVNDDDEWNFASALPDQPSTQTVINTSIRTDFTVSRQSDDVIHIHAAISNNMPTPVSELTMQLAVTRGYTLKLEPQSGRLLQPNQQNGITQNIHLHGVQRGQGAAVKMRWRASYILGSERKEEQGEISSLGVS
ncbi:vhs domain-containing protein [Diplodia corticola]|uniref:Vhs domain-containing protein n=1 Tax=Diplodia corticola TaxID=236234 RepID=A0A1J9RZJ7_9PEZI|nr:vhs domain-containing protein [Diplodia corticola]OJD38099.1 vhs domain-containing protein [Diplodia corticola]